MTGSRLALIALLGCLALSPAQAEIDCEFYANYAGAEPPGYAEECLGRELVGGPRSISTPADPTDTGFKYDMRNTVGLYSYQVGDFDNQTFIANPFTPPQVGFAWDFDSTGTTLWAHNFTTTQFGTVNTTTGAFTPVAPVVLPGGQTFTGLTIDPVNDTFYVTGTNGVTSTLYTLNPQTGVPTVVGNIGALTLVIDVAMNCNGEMYIHDIGTDSLYSVNPATGAPTLRGSHGLAANFAQGMDFDNADGTLYGCIYTGGGTNTYASWNTTTGAITPLNVNSPLGEWECMIPTTCPLGDADLSVGKTVDDPTPSPGDTVVFTVTVDNLGPADALNVVVTDTLPAGLTFVSTTGCAEDPAGVPTCSLGTILAGGSDSYTITATVDVGASGVLTNSATAAADNPDPDPADNTGTADVTVQADADLAVSKTVDDTSPAPGGTVVFTVTVDNLGPADATNVVVTDTLPAGLTFVSTTGCAEDPNGVPTCSLGTILAGGSDSYTITATVDTDASGQLTNTATASADNADPVTANNSASAILGVQQSALEIPTLGQFGMGLLALLLVAGGVLMLRRRMGV